jgi:rhodanese-related sulfurtransferase
MFSMFRKTEPGLDAKGAIPLVASGELTLIDVREPSEIKASGKAAGAIAIPLGILPLKANPALPDHDKRLSRDKPIAVYCLSGARSANAKRVLEGLGYTNVSNIGGFGNWQQAGGKIERA